MKRGVQVKGDGNGGWDVNVQKSILRKWGPIGLLIFVLVSGAGSKLGEEVWTLIVESRAVKEKIATHDSDIASGKVRDEDLAKQITGLREEVRADLREIKAEVRAISRSLNSGG